MKFSWLRKKQTTSDKLSDDTPDSMPADAPDYAPEHGRRCMPEPVKRFTPAQVRSHENQMRVIEVLGRHGYADTHFTAVAAFADYKSGYEMARRALNQLLKDGRVEKRHGAAHGCDVYVITTSGAELASDRIEYEVNPATELKTPTSPTLLHRLIGYYYLQHFATFLRAKGLKFEYLTEREIECNLDTEYIDRKSSIGKRKPDGIILLDYDEHFEAIWVEVERGYKTHERFHSQLTGLLPMMDKNIAPIGCKEVILRNIHYVCDPRVVDVYKLGASIRKVASATNHIDAQEGIYVFRANIAAPYRIESLSGLIVTEIDETRDPETCGMTAEEAESQDFRCGLNIPS